MPRTLLLAVAVLAAAPAAAQVTLYSGTYLQGERQTFRGDIGDLDDTPFGANHASSVDVAPGCVVTLFERRQFRGRSVEIRDRDNNLGNTPVGRNAVSSFQIRCSRENDGGGFVPSRPRPERPRRGAVLYRDRDLDGPSELFERDARDLSRSSIGPRRASSVDVAPGCLATLYSEPDYRGRETTFREADNNLGNTPVGEDAAMSIRIRCEGDRLDPAPPRGSGERGVTLYRDRNREGTSETFSFDVADLGRSRIGGRTASSVDVSPGCEATLYSEPGFRGRETTFREADNNLKNTSVGEDAAMSLRVRCR